MFNETQLKFLKNAISKSMSIGVIAADNIDVSTAVNALRDEAGMTYKSVKLMKDIRSQRFPVTYYTAYDNRIEFAKNLQECFADYYDYNDVGVRCRMFMPILVTYYDGKLEVYKAKVQSSGVTYDERV
jgi:hypothetical protein